MSVIVLAIASFLLLGARAQSPTTLPFCYTLLPAAGSSLYGNWQVVVNGTMQLSPATAGASLPYNSSYYTQAWTVTSITGTRTYVDGTGATQVTAITGPVSPQYVYAPSVSALSASLGNTNLIYTNAAGSGGWVPDQSGLSFYVSSSGTGSSPGMPGFPTTALFNQSTIITISASNSSSTLQLTETGYGPSILFPTLGLAGPGVYTPNAQLAGTVSTQATIGVGATCNAVPAAAPSYITQSLCYILYPDETAQNGMWSIAFSALLYTSSQAITIPASSGLTGRAYGAADYTAYVIYGMANVTRTYTDQFGAVYTTTGAQLQGIGGDGGTNNLLYTSVNSSDVYGGLFDDDGFSVTWLNGVAVPTPGDPTGAYGINFYYEDNYREAAEPWHQDNEFGGAGTSLTVQPASSVASCQATPFTAVTQPANYNASLPYTFCALISGSGGWSVNVSALLQMSATNFSSNGSNNTQLYKVGTGISGTIAIVSTTGGTAQTATITGLVAPGNSYNSNKLYNLATHSTLFDGGGWLFTVAPAVTLPGTTSSTSMVRLFNSGNNWQLQGVPAFTLTSVSTAATATAAPGSTLTCSAAGGGGSTAATSLPFCYTLLPAAGSSLYGNWQVVVNGTMQLSPATAGASLPYNSSYYTQAWTVTSITGTRTYVDGTGATQVTAITGPVSPQYVYAPSVSALSASLGNTNLIYTNAAGSGGWVPDQSGLSFYVSSSGTGSSPGMPGFPTTALFNQSTIITISASNSSSTLQLTETGYGPSILFPTLGLAGPGVYTPNAQLAGTVSTQATIGVGATCNAVPAAAPSYITQSLCYILYPDETAQNGMWSIAFSALLYTSSQAITIPASSGLTGRAYGAADYTAYVIYGMANVTRTYTDQFGAVYTTTGAQLQGIGGDGGTNNLLYTSVNSSDVYGGLFDDDGFSVTWLNGVAVPTPGDPTGAYGINFYYEDNYREAAEPWHQDNEFGGAGTSLTVQPASSVASCQATPFTAVTQPANYNASLPYTFCALISGSGGWSVNVSALLQMSATNFSSNGSNNTQLYKVGTGISGTIAIVSTTGGTAQTATITGLVAPGNSYNSNKLYNLATHSTLFDGGGWLFTVAPAVTLPGTTSSTSMVRLFNSGNNWQLQGVPAFTLTSVSTAATATAAPGSTLTCSAAGGGGSTAATSLPFCYTLLPAAGSSLYGNWQVVVNGTMQLSPATAGASLPYNSSYYTQAWTVTSITGTRTYVDGTGATQVTAITGPVSPQYVYAPSVSALSASLGNTNLIYTNAAGSGGWVPDQSGLSFYVSSSGTGSSPGMPGFPTTALFNQSTIITISASNSSSTLQLTETGYGPSILFPTLGLAGPGVYTPNAQLAGTVSTQATIGVGATCNAVPAAAPSYITQSLCYILYPDETAQNGMWSIAFSALLYTSSQAITIPASSGLTGRAYGAADYTAYVIYGMANVTRTYTDQFGAVYTTTGAQLQGIGGDGGTNNLLYTSVNSSDVYGGLFDDDGFSVTWLNGVAVPTPGDPTGAYGINFYYEDNYREAAEPWHQDNEFGGAGTSLTVQPASSVASCQATPFTAVTQPANYNASLPYTFCALISGSGGWSVNVSALLQMSATNFSSNGSNNTQLYKVGTGISGTIAIVSTTGGTAQTATITGLVAPGNSYNSNKLYNLATHSTLFDGGGWLFTVAPAVTLPGTTSSTSMVRLFNSGNNWQLQGVPAFTLTSVSTAATATAAPGSTLTCSAAGGGGSTAATSLPFCYTLLPAAGSSLYGNWQVVVNGTMQLSPATAGASLPYNSSYYTQAWTVTSITGTRTYVDGTGATQVTAITGPVSPQYVYAPSVSALSASLGNTNLIYTNAAGSGGWVPDQSGLSFYVSSSGTGSSPGMPGFPTTALFNQSTIITISASNSSSTLQLTETGYGPSILFPTLGLAGPGVYTPNAQLAGTVSTQATIGVGATCNAVPAAAPSYITQSLCYILYPDETAQNGMWSIAFSALLYTSSQAITIPASSGLTGRAYGAADYTAYVIYGMANVTRTYTDQFGAVYTTTGAQLQGIGGDGGTNNLLYTSVNSSDVYGGLFDDDGFSVTWLNGVAVPTPGDPTGAYGINFYYEDNYREAAEPWHQDNEFGGAGTSLTVQPASSVASCQATPFTAVTQPANYNASLPYTFCALISGSGGWSVNVSALLQMSATNFSSNGSNNTQLYKVGTGISGTIAIVSTTGGTAQTATITGLVAPGNSYNSNKLYNLATHSTLFDGGGWLFTVAPAVTLPGTTSSTSMVRLFNSGNNWQLQGVPAFTLTSVSTAATATAAPGSTLTCSAAGGGGSTAATSLPFCYTLLPAAGSSLYGNWQVVVNGTMQLSPATAGASLPYNSSYYTQAWTVTSITGTRTYVGRHRRDTGDSDHWSRLAAVCVCSVCVRTECVVGQTPT